LGNRSVDTAIHKVLRQAQVKPLAKPRRVTHPKRYSRPVPGDRIQIDTMKIATGVYQYTAIDDCSRFRVLGLYPRRTAKYTIEFLERVIEEMPFSIQRIQTDRGSEFFAESVQRWMADHCIKFRPIAPRSPHLNGKVERSQLTDLQEFWPRFKVKDPEIAQRIEEWQFDYNWRRGHGSLKGKTPAEWSGRFAEKVPLREEVEANYDASKERLQLMNWSADQRLARLISSNKKTSTAHAKS
jgi:transposase InsO family protein